MVRWLYLLAALLILGPTAVSARSVVDSAGRRVEVPDHIARVAAAGPPAGVLIYVLAPEKMVGWPHEPSDLQMHFLMPSVRSLPETGQLTAKDGTADLSAVVATKPDVIIDVGAINDRYKSIADKVQAKTGLTAVLPEAAIRCARSGS